jgi:hypothetical protein
MTAQAPDKLIYGEKEVPLYGYPLQPYLDTLARKPAINDVPTCNYRGYVATWEVSERFLYLTDLRDFGCGETLESLFPGNEGKVLAEWFSGELHALVGELHWEFLFYTSPEVLVLVVERGTVVDQRVVASSEVEQAARQRRKEGGTPGDADRGNNCDYASRLGTKPETRRESCVMHVVGALVTFLGVLAFKEAARGGPDSYLPLVAWSVIFVLCAVVAGFVSIASQEDGPTIARRKSGTLKYKTYDEVPWYRREPGDWVFIAALLFPPVSIALCIICLTGDIYREGSAYVGPGSLHVWGVGNKVAAVLILVLQIGLIGLFSLAVAAHIRN